MSPNTYDSATPNLGLDPTHKARSQAFDMHRPRGAWEGPAQAGGTGTPMSAEGFGACGGVPWDARSLFLGSNGSRSIPASGSSSDPATRLTGEPFNRWEGSIAAAWAVRLATDLRLGPQVPAVDVPGRSRRHRCPTRSSAGEVVRPAGKRFRRLAQPAMTGSSVIPLCVASRKAESRPA